MNKFKRKRHGSSLIFVIIIFMFVLVVSGAMLSMVVGNFSARAKESKRVENLYRSESGLDTAYNVIAKTIENANEYGMNKVDNMKLAKDFSYDDYEHKADEYQKALYAIYADIDYLELDEEKNKSEIKEDYDKIDQLINCVFKKNFQDYINEHLKNNVEGNESGEDKGKSGTYLISKLNDKQTVDYDGAIITFTEDALENSKMKWNEEESHKQSMPGDELVVKYGYDKDEKKIVPKDKYYNLGKYFYYEPDEAHFKLTSEFSIDSSDSNAYSVGSNKRTISVSYTLTIPNYDEVAFKTSIVDKPAKAIPQIIVGGDMEANNADVNVTGDIFVQGNDISDVLSDHDVRTYKKYDSGIKLNSNRAGKNNINFNNNVYTRGTFNIKNNINSTISGNLYAKNIYSGDYNSGNEITGGSTLTVDSDGKEVIVENDLAVKADAYNIKIGKFYGISDINGRDNEENARKSSSIIINNYNKPSSDTRKIEIENEAYIAGVAHINTTDDGYETGESVAVKGNYNAYSIPVDKDEKFDYKNPLQLVDGDENDKAEHFYNYWNGKSDLDCGGVVFKTPSNVCSIGAIVSGSTVYPANYTIEQLNQALTDQREKYAKYVYRIGGDSSISDFNSANALLVNHYIDFNKITDDYEKDNAIFTNKPVVILGSGHSDTNYDDYYKVSADSDLKAVVVSNDDIVIDGDVSVIGNLITNGNLIIKENSNANIYYDKNTVEKIQSKNKLIFNNVFGSEYGGDELDEADKATNVESNSTDFVKAKLWKIIK